MRHPRAVAKHKQLHLADTVSRTRNRHNMRFGVEVKRHEVDVDAPFSSVAAADKHFRRFLLGLSAAQNGSRMRKQCPRIAWEAPAFPQRRTLHRPGCLIQDDIKLTQRLTGTPAYAMRSSSAIDITDCFRISIPDCCGAGSGLGSLSGFTCRQTIPARRSGVTKTSIAACGRPAIAMFLRARLRLQLTRAGRRIARRIWFLLRPPFRNFAEGQLGQQPFSLQQISFNAQNGRGDAAKPLQSAASSSFKLPHLPAGIGREIVYLRVSPTFIDPYTQEYNLNLQFAFARDFLLEPATSVPTPFTRRECGV